MNEPDVWEIYWADVKFEDKEEIKRRPVLIIDKENLLYVTLNITLHEERNQWGEYDITQWKSAGLQKPSTIRVTKVQKLSREQIHKKIGKLAPYDIIRVSRKLEI